MDHRARGDTGAGVDGHTGGLVDHHEMRVVPQHCQIERFRRQLRWPRGWNPHLDFGAGARTQRRLCRPPRDAHRLALDELLHPRSRQRGQTRGDQLVEPRSGLGRPDAQADDLHQIFDLMCPLRARITSINARSKKFVLAYSLGSTRPW